MRQSFLPGVDEDLQLFGVLPEADAAFDGVAVCAEEDVRGQILHELGVAATEQDVVADERGLKARDDVEDGGAPALLAAQREAGEADVLLVGAAFLLRQG